MRRSRIVVCVAFLLAAFCPPPAAVADSVDSEAHDSTLTITVHVRDEAPLTAAVAAWRPYEQILVVFQDGTDRVVPAHRVLKVVDGSGTDRTRFLIHGRGFVGEYPEAYRGARSPKPSHSRSFLAFAGAALGAALLAFAIVTIAIGSQGG